MNPNLFTCRKQNGSKKTKGPRQQIPVPGYDLGNDQARPTSQTIKRQSQQQKQLAVAFAVKPFPEKRTTKNGNIKHRRCNFWHHSLGVVIADSAAVAGCKLTANGQQLPQPKQTCSNCKQNSCPKPCISSASVSGSASTPDGSGVCQVGHDTNFPPDATFCVLCTFPIYYSHECGKQKCQRLYAFKLS
ncbi:uncharacterized protein [Drosophila bipectinata]|uniref:uncharacterized protein n=1 Tax=Drosophila bipectinata TaxID=42026 RepID=UPI0038B2C2B7